MKDPLTGEEFEPKRSNQRFACPEKRIKFHNNDFNRRRKKWEFINKPLRKNGKILDYWMNGKEKATFHIEFLRGAGYDFNVFNGTCIVKNKTGYCLYNYILIFEETFVHVSRNDRP